MSKLIAMYGPPACGKSTRAAEMMKEYGNYVRINKDSLRTMLHFDVFTGKHEEITQNVAESTAENLLTKGVNVIIDDTNLNPKTLERWRQLAGKVGAGWQVVDLSNVPIEECIRRDSERTKMVGATVIKQMAMQYLDYLKGERVVICDIDGTVANVEHRRHFVQQDPKDWDSFFSNMMLDKPRVEVWEQVAQMCKERNAKLIFVSARPEKYRPFTMDWLRGYMTQENGLNDAFELLIMRPNKDTRPDTVVKEEIYEKYLKKLDIMAVFDDRPSVIRMWRSHFLNVVDVGNGEEF